MGRESLINPTAPPASGEGPKPATGPHGRRARSGRSRAMTWRLLWWLGAFTVPLVWQLYASWADSTLVPGPLDVLRAIPPMLETGELQAAIWQSGVVFVSGTVAGTVIGLVLGGLMGRFRALDVTLDPYLAAAYAVPSIAVIPLLIVIIGWGPVSKAIIIAFLVFLPITINAATGVRHASRELRELAYVFCSSEYARWRDVLVPSALPAVLPGLRVALARALTALIVAEFSTLVTGLGYLIHYYSFAFQIEKSLVPVVVLGLVGFGLYRVLDYGEARLMPWALRE